MYTRSVGGLYDIRNTFLRLYIRRAGHLGTWEPPSSAPFENAAEAIVNSPVNRNNSILFIPREAPLSLSLSPSPSYSLSLVTGSI